MDQVLTIRWWPVVTVELNLLVLEIRIYLHVHSFQILGEMFLWAYGFPDQEVRVIYGTQYRYTYTGS